MEKIVSKNFDRPECFKLSVYEGAGGYEGLRKALKMKPAEVTELVKASGLRGRGGAGFSAGMKWGFIPENSGKPTYLCVNADEGEPGTFKDREILLRDPHLLIEGIVIAAYAIECHTAYVYVRGEFIKESKRLQSALNEARAKKYFGKNILGSGYDLEIHVHMGAGAYICGEETALIESIEGKRGLPRLKPPFPAVEGLFRCPTIVNNVETLANLPDILLKGVQWYRQWGTEKAPGMRLFAVSGHVQKPGVYELPINVPLMKLITQHAGGLRPGRRLKAVIPGGASSAVLRADECDVTMDFESLAGKGTMAGSGAVIVMDDTTCMVKALRVLAQFFAHESCGQCTPCREGTSWAADIIRRLETGEGTRKDLDLLYDICDNMKGKTICVFSDAAAAPIESIVKKFREEFDQHLADKRCRLAVAS
ncbi:MAG TPA: NADH-quinone oxidoreductase subunit NuoF [Bdellovibrionota bacterium]|nr:NADH-quinone oxidoreductase subunit NuoF [Bdellovibrionota bacterium]